ncbi:MAG: transglycosylase SLT domain-containing protein [Spirochaetaceae bacterium]|nr:transglycosylase SLT domain-containing protein [Spirochaetaceae bacterium]
MSQRPRLKAWLLLFFCFVLGFPVVLARAETPVTGEPVAARAAAAQTASPAPSGDLPERPLRARTYLDARRFVWHGAVESGLVIEGLERELTRRYIRQYLSPGGLAWLKTVMDRAAPYLPFIREEITKRALPPELVYLPVIESAYLTTAVSRSGAVGLWQFMRNSIGPFGIQVNEWMDERMDFWKATQAALDKLGENYRYFGDWALALAAYNAGLGAVRRIRDSSGINDYWELSERGLLRNETVHYVPKFLAVSFILSRAGRHGLDLGWPEPVAWTRLAPGRSVDLELLAQAAGINPQSLKEANRELVYTITPPLPDYLLKVPAQNEAALRQVLEDGEANLLRYYLHTIHSGDTLSALARHYGVSVELISRTNPSLEPRYLRIGERILIPALRDAAPYEPVRNTAGPAFEGNHLVKRGETLWSIALAYDVDPEALADANGMQLNDTLREGRTLKTPIR